jgi:hypothetical protein
MKKQRRGVKRCNFIDVLPTDQIIFRSLKITHLLQNLSLSNAVESIISVTKVPSVNL